MEEQATKERIDRLEERIDERFSLRAEIRETFGEASTELGELRSDIKSLRQTMIYGFFTLGGLLLILNGLMFTFAVLQLA
jgi:hypothetical protein